MLQDAQEGLAAAERLASEKEAEVAAMDAAAQRHRCASNTRHRCWGGSACSNPQTVCRGAKHKSSSK